MYMKLKYFPFKQMTLGKLFTIFYLILKELLLFYAKLLKPERKVYEMTAKYIYSFFL